MNLKLKIWRQKNSDEAGKLVEYNIDDVSPDMSFLEMLDVLNNNLIDTQAALNLSEDEVKTLLINSFKSSFLNEEKKRQWISKILD